jgi:raffinose synthase
MTIHVCNDLESHVTLEFSEEQLLILSADPFTGPRRVHLHIPQGCSHALCAYLHQDTEAFTVPLCVTSFRQIPCKSYFVLVQDRAGQNYTVYFCLSHQDVSSSLCGTEEGLMLELVSGTSEDAKKVRPVLLCLRGEHLYDTIQQAMKLALSLTGGMGKLLKDKLSLPNWLDYLGWESGLAMGLNVSHENIVEAVKSLVDAGYSPGFVLIDEGWQHVENEFLTSFEADLMRFPKGIKGVVEDLVKLGIKHIGVWHGMMGYRGGVHADLAKTYDLPCDAKGRYFLGCDLGRTFEFFYDYYGYLREQGVTFIKVGDQSSVADFCHNDIEVTALYKNLQHAMQAATSIQFNSAHFNTECLRNENLFYWGSSRIARAAEDINIATPDGALSAIRNNLTNSLWLQHLMKPDFDAWLTHGEYCEALAIFHALSGSINVIGDPSGKHNKSLINKFVLPSGRILKADNPLTLCQESVFCDPLEEKKIYKAFTFKGGYGIVGAFNLNKAGRTLHGTVSPKDVEGLKGDLFALLSHHNGFIKIVQPDESVAITLKPHQSDVFTFAPVHDGIAVLGGCSFFLAPGPLLDVDIEEESIHISTLVSTRILIYCERQILEVRRNGKTIPWEYESKRHILSIDSRDRDIAAFSVYIITFEA